MKWIVFLLFVGPFFRAEASSPNFDFFCRQLLQRQPSLSDYSSYFTRGFREQIPFDRLKSVFEAASSEVGQCVSYKVRLKSPDRYELVLNGDKKFDASFSVALDGATGLVSGLLYEGASDPSIQIGSWRDVEKALSGFDKTGALSTALVTERGALQFGYRHQDVFATGSTFKLYLLGALEQSIARGEHRWDEILPLKEEWKSLPSGVMHTWTAGQKVTLYEYAEKMISLSDNTAADHLLYFLGRDSVEGLLPTMGNVHEGFYFPFLSTSELFKLKWAIRPAETQAYLRADLPSRRRILQTLTQIPRARIGSNGVPLSEPTLNDKIEWFGTTVENCKAMLWLAAREKPQIRAILSKNVPVLGVVGSAESHWAYAGYKGGSEPGVLSMTYVLESKRANRVCFSMSWNNRRQNISQVRFFDLVKKTLRLVETQVP